MTQILDATTFIARYGLDRESLEPIANLLRVATNGPWLVGGSIRRLITHAPQDSDFDVGFSSPAQLDATGNTLLSLGFKQSNDTLFHREFKGDLLGKPITIQLLRLTFADTPSAIISEFDYTICMCAYDGSALHLGDYTLFDLGRKRLVINKVTFASSTVRRLIKYTKQGYYACRGCIDSILNAVANDPSLIHSEVLYVD